MKMVRVRHSRSILQAVYQSCLMPLSMGALSVCIPLGSAVAALIGVHEQTLDGVSVALTPNPQPALAGNGTGANPLFFNLATLDSIASSTGGSYTTPDGFFTITGAVEAVNDSGQSAALMLTVTAVDNKPVVDGQLGGDILEVIFRQDYVLATNGVGLAEAQLDGTCNQSAQDAMSKVDVGVNLTSAVSPALTGSCAPFGQFFASSASTVAIGPNLFIQPDLFFNFREGPAGQALTVSLQASVPEPPTLLLSATGLIGMMAFGWRRRAPRVS